jgi:uncharacterized protein (TIGR03437 family)
MHVDVAKVAPGIFTAGADGRGPAAAQIIRVHADGSQTPESALDPISFGPEPVYLVLYATGIRNRSDSAAVTCTIGSFTLAVDYAGAQPAFPGLDQVNVLLPPKLAGSGLVNVLLTGDGVSSNIATVNFQ